MYIAPKYKMAIFLWKEKHCAKENRAGKIIAADNSAIMPEER
jgi:hypothetical protein